MSEKEDSYMGLCMSLFQFLSIKSLQGNTDFALLVCATNAVFVCATNAPANPFCVPVLWSTITLGALILSVTTSHLEV